MTGGLPSPLSVLSGMGMGMFLGVYLVRNWLVPKYKVVEFGVIALNVRVPPGALTETLRMKL